MKNVKNNIAKALLISIFGFLLICILLCLTGCTEADQVNYKCDHMSAEEKLCRLQQNLNGLMEETNMNNTGNTPDNVRRFTILAKKIVSTYESKNHDYGDSFHNSVQKYGLVAAITRMSDKFGRAESLILNPKDQKVNDESLKDTLLDLATYAIMTAMELENKNNE